MNSQTRTSDFLVIGSGIAGLSFAIKASAYGTVNIVTKKKNYDSNTNYAQGGIASVMSENDSFEFHIDDTMTAGAGICNPRAVDILAHNGPERIRELMEWGVKFSAGDTGLDLGMEGGHSRKRIVHAFDMTGREIERALLAHIAENPRITVFEDHTAVDLLTEHQLRIGHDGTPCCYGAYIMENATRAVHAFTARVTMIASGGAGCVYLHTTNPSIATGDGIALAYRAGAHVADMEFMQFHPTTLYQEKKTGKALLISEAVRGEGAILINGRGERFMKDVHPLAELAPRDIVARAIDRELKASGDPCVYLDISFKDAAWIRERFPYIYQHCLEAGVDITAGPVPVVPAAHYLCGGIVTDVRARTSIRNCYASGESACTGVHGANRLASNSLLEAVVFSHNAIQDAAARLAGIPEPPEFPAWSKEGTFDPEEWILIQHNIDEIRRLMWDYVGIVRTNHRLQRAMRRIVFLQEEITDYYRRSTLSSQLVELRNLTTAAKLMIQGASQRKESRGLHYNRDYPDTNAELALSTVFHKGRDPVRLKLEDVHYAW